MSFNMHQGKFDYLSRTQSVKHASWAVHHLSDALFWNDKSATAVANYAARLCWTARFGELDDPLQHSSSAECVEMILS